MGSPEWSQKVDEAAANPIVSHKNVAYSLHFYAATQFQWLRDRAAAAMQAGICIFVTEWGTVEANGDGLLDTHSVSDWVKFLDKHMISHANWCALPVMTLIESIILFTYLFPFRRAINDKDEGASALLPGASSTGDWKRSDYSP